jgi:hypothetical protein
MDGTAATGLRRHSNRRTSTRAPRGANREKALSAIRDQPGISVAQLSAATGISKNVLYGLMRTLTDEPWSSGWRVAMGGWVLGCRAGGGGDR